MVDCRTLQGLKRDRLFAVKFPRGGVDDLPAEIPERERVSRRREQGGDAIGDLAHVVVPTDRVIADASVRMRQGEEPEPPAGRRTDALEKTVVALRIDDDDRVSATDGLNRQKFEETALPGSGGPKD